MQTYYGTFVLISRLFVESAGLCTEEISCTSKNRQWGIPSETQTIKDPIIKSPIRRDKDKKGVSSAFYDPRRCETNIHKISDFQTKRIEKDESIGFAHAIYLNLVTKSKTQYGDFIIGSTSSHQLLPLESNITVIMNIEYVQNNNNQHDYMQLPLLFLSDEIAHTDWGFITCREIMLLDSIKVEEND